MVKRKCGGKQRYNKAGKASEEAAEQQHGPAPPQHVQRKVNRKVQFLERVAASKQAALQQRDGGVKKKNSKQKRKLQVNLESLAGSLEELVAGGSGASVGAAPNKQKAMRLTSVKHSVNRTVVNNREMNRLQQVLQHPAYQADPIAAITRHLEATLPPPKTTAAAAAAARSKAAKGGKRKQKQKQGHQGAAPMVT